MAGLACFFLIIAILAIIGFAVYAFVALFTWLGLAGLAMVFAGAIVLAIIFGIIAAET